MAGPGISLRSGLAVTLDRILIAGCGNMGGAMLAGWLRGGLDPARFKVVDPALATVPAGVTLLCDPPTEPFDAVLLGLKPQALVEAAAALGPATRGAAVLSLLAGADLATLTAKFPDAAGVVRVMPNLAAALGKSPIALAGTGLRAAIGALLEPLGAPEWVDEAQFDLLTALIGSGPAFIYRFITALSDGASTLGLHPAQARRFALGMAEGAVALAAASPETPAELAQRVTSAGGTTAAGLAVLDRDDALGRLVETTLRGARDRGAELAATARGDAATTCDE